MIGAIEKQLKKIVHSERDQRQKSFKTQRAVKKQKETVDMIARLKEDRLNKERLEKNRDKQ